MFVYQKTMFACYHCTKSFCHLKNVEIRIKKFVFVFTCNGAHKRERSVGFKNTYNRAKTCVIVTSLNYVLFYARYC